MWMAWLSWQVAPATETVDDPPTGGQVDRGHAGIGSELVPGGEPAEVSDARSVAIAALRSPGLRSVVPADHGELLRLLAKRNHETERNPELFPNGRVTD